MQALVLTHAHVDHVGGTGRSATRRVYATPLTSELLDGEMPIDAYKAFMPAFADEFDDLAELGTRPVTHLVDGAAQLTPRVEVLPASGHTAGDLMVLVADVDVLLRGRPLLLRRHAARVPGRPRHVGRRCSTRSPSSPR